MDFMFKYVTKQQRPKKKKTVAKQYRKNSKVIKTPIGLKFT